MPAYPPTTEPLRTSHPVTASIVSPITVPTHGAGGAFSVLAKTHIAAPPALVLRTIRNTNEWYKWNSFCPRCVIEPKRSTTSSRPSTDDDDGALQLGNDGWLGVGSSAVIEVFMNGDGLDSGKKKSREQGIVVTRLERLKDGSGGGRTGYRIAWKSTGFSYWQLHSERVMEFVDWDGGTEYSCWETFGGLLGSVVKATVGGQLVDRFGDYARDVKGYVEGLGKGEAVNGSA